MITSVGKAKEKWCPFDKGQVSPRVHSAGTCHGPECMMWRFGFLLREPCPQKKIL